MAPLKPGPVIKAVVPGRVTPTQQTWEETHESQTPGHLTRSCCPNTLQGGGCSWRFWASLYATGSGPGQFSPPALGQKAGLVAADPRLCFLGPRRAPLGCLLTLGAVDGRQLPAGFPLLSEAPAFWGGRRKRAWRLGAEHTGSWGCFQGGERGHCPFVSLELNTTPAVHHEKGNCFPHVLSGKQGHSDFQFLVHKFNTG